MSENKKEIRQLLMIISSIRSKDNERYEEHVKFSNEVIEFIKKMQNDMNSNWSKIHDSMSALKKSVDGSLDSLLTGINPEGIQETSKNLKSIMNTMNKSMQAMNLENVMRELRVMTGVEIDPSALAAMSSAVMESGGGGGDVIQAGSSPAKGKKGKKGKKASATQEVIPGYTAADLEEIKKAYGGELPPNIQAEIDKHKNKGKKKDADPHARDEMGRLLNPSNLWD